MLGFPSRQGIHVLEASSGRGDLAVYLAKKFRGWNIQGVELDDERLGMAQNVQEKLQLPNLGYKKADLLSFKPDQAIQLITCCDVLEHIDQDVEVMQNLHEILDRDGVMILTFPSVPQRKHLRLVDWKEKRMGIDPLEAAGHVRQGYSVDGIQATLKGIGFTEVGAWHTYGFWGTLCFDLFFLIGDSKPNPILFFLAFPWLMMFAWLDVWFPSKQGSALLVVARK
jgi:trans-aconitate methyltransferase